MVTEVPVPFQVESMRRLPKLLIGGFLLYAIMAANAEQQARMADGVLALKDAVVDACTRPNGSCAQFIGWFASAAGIGLHDSPASWMDDPAKRDDGIRVIPPANATSSPHTNGHDRASARG